MEHDALGRCALYALRVLACGLVLAAAGCKKDEASGAGPGNSQSGLDGGGGDPPGEGEIADPRIGPDGAIQVREEPAVGCDMVNATGGSYFFCSDPLPSTMAVGSCWAAGSTLVTINDAGENQLLVDEMVEDEYWIGFSDATEEDNWAWAEGSTGSSFENWDEGQPAIDDFVFIKRETGLWSTSTDVPRPYICEVWR